MQQRASEISPAHRFDDDCRWYAPKSLFRSFWRKNKTRPRRSVSLIKFKCLSNPDSDQKSCSADANRVRKLFWVHLLYLYSYLLSKGIFHLCGRSAQECIDQLLFASLQVKLTLMLHSSISEFKLVITFLFCLSTIREPASVRFVSALNVSEMTLNTKLETSH